MSVRLQTFLWLFGFVFLAGCVWILRDVLSPFIIGLVVAYLLNPLVVYLEKKKCRRWLASLIILVGFVVSVFIVLTLVLPIAYKQMLFFVEAIPEYYQSIVDLLSPYHSYIEGWVSDQVWGC